MQVLRPIQVEINYLSFPTKKFNMERKFAKITSDQFHFFKQERERKEHLERRRRDQGACLCYTDRWLFTDTNNCYLREGSYRTIQ